MKPANIAIVWAPNLLRDAPGDEHMALVNIPKTHRCIQSLVENYDEIFHANVIFGFIIYTSKVFHDD